MRNTKKVQKSLTKAVANETAIIAASVGNKMRFRPYLNKRHVLTLKYIKFTLKKIELHS